MRSAGNIGPSERVTPLSSENDARSDRLSGQTSAISFQLFCWLLMSDR